MNYSLRKTLFSLSLVGIFLLPSSFIFAQTTPSAPLSVAGDQQIQITPISVEAKNDFVLEPGKIEIYANPGDVITKYISITSRIQSKTEFQVTTEDFVGSQSEQQPVVLLGNGTSPY